MRIAIVTFDGFNELDAFIALGLLNGVTGWKAEITSPATYVSSMGGVTVQAQRPLAFANDADAVVFGSGLYHRAIAQHSALLDRLQLDPVRQTFAAQGSGVLLLARLGLLADRPACTDVASKPWLIEAGVRVEDAPFHARGPVATAGGSLATQLLAAWLMVRGAGFEFAAKALRHAAPVGEQDAYVARLLDAVRPFMATPAAPPPP
jgi:transcriptional regulator GlxA family with amidase domain